MGNLRGRMLFFGFVCWVCAMPVGAIINGAPPGEDDTRFDAVGAFGRASWMGVGSDPLFDHEWHCTVTLVADNIVFGADHCIDNNLSASGFVVRFRRRPDGGLGSLAAGVDSYFQVPISSWLVRRGDFFAARLAEPIGHVTPIPVALYGIHSLADEPFWQAGWGKEGPEFNAGPRRQLLLCENRLHSTNTMHTFSTAWSPSGSGCGVNVNDSGSPQLLEDTEAGALRLIGVTSTTSQGVNLHFMDADPQLGLVHTNWTLPDAAVDKVSVAPLYVEPGEVFRSIAYIANAGAGLVPAGAKITAKFFGNAQGWQNGRTFFDGTTDAPLGPLRYPISEEHQVANDAPIGSYFVRWNFADNLNFVERFDRNNFGYSSYVSVAPRFPTSRENWVGYWKDDDHPDFPGNGLFLMHRRADQSVALAAMNRSTGDLHLFTRLMMGENERLEMQLANGTTYAGARLPSDDPRVRDRWTLQAQDDSSTLIAEKISEAYLSGFAAGLYRGRVQSPSGGRVMIWMTTEQKAAFVFQSDDVQGIAYANFVPSDWSLVSFMATNGPTEASVASLTAQLEWHDGNHEWVLSGNVQTSGGEEYAFSAHMEWDVPSPRTWFGSCQNDWQCEDGMGQDAFCVGGAGEGDTGFCSAVCGSASDCAEGSCWLAEGFCVPTCENTSQCPAGYRCQQNRCLDSTIEPLGSDAGTMSDGGTFIEDAGIQDGSGGAQDSGVNSAGDGGQTMTGDAAESDGSFAPTPSVDGGPLDASGGNDAGPAADAIPLGAGCGGCDAGDGHEGMLSLVLLGLLGGLRRRRT